MGPEWCGAFKVDAGHVPVVLGIPAEVEWSGKKGPHLGGQKERVGPSLLTERGFVASASAGAAERPAPVCRIYRDLVGQPPQPDLQRCQRLEREVHGEMWAEEIRARDAADHHSAS